MTEEKQEQVEELELVRDCACGKDAEPVETQEAEPLTQEPKGDNDSESTRDSAERTYLFIASYLISITAANLIITRYGKTAVIPVGFLLIGFDLIARDRLHDTWRKGYLKTKMAALILSGSLIAFIINSASWRIGLASFTAFTATGIVDTFVYQKLIDRPLLQRMNGSNLFSATVDSFVFLPVAFGSFPWLFMAGQATAKIVGGGVWSYLFKRWSI